MTAQLAFGADFAGDAGHFRGERAELIHHHVDRVFQIEDFAAHVHRDFARQIAFRHRRRHIGDVSHLAGQVVGHVIDVIGQIFPRSGYAAHIGLHPKFALGADFAGDAGDFRGERTQLIHHRIDGVLQFENFAPRIRRDFARQIAFGHRRGHISDISHLAGQITGHVVDVVGQIFPRAADALHIGLAAQFAFGADFAGDAGDFRGERTELVNHRIDGVFQFQNFAPRIRRDFLAQIAFGNCGRDIGDISHLAGQIARHQIDVIGQIFPGASHAAYIGLTAQLAFGADFPRHPRYFRGE